MEFKFNNSHIQTSYFKAEDYFPATVIFSEEELNNCFIKFSLRPTDILELCVHPESYALKSLVLTLCNHFAVYKQSLVIPECQEGCIYISGPKRTECTKFMANVFTDGLRIDLSDKPAVRHLKCGQLIFAIDSANNLVALYIVDLTESDIKHVISELYEQ